MASRVNEWCGRRWPSVLSALLLLLAFPPFNIWPLVFVALVPLLYHLRDADKKESWRAGYFFGLIYFAGQTTWLFSLAAHWTGSPLLSFLPWILVAFAGAVYFGWLGRLVRWCNEQNKAWLFPIFWAGVEVFRSYIPVISFPWGLIATPLYRSPFLIQTAHYGTIYLVSGWIVLLNVSIAAALRKDSLAIARPLLAGFLALLGVSGFTYLVKPSSKIFPVTVGQPGVDMAFGNPNTAHSEAARKISGFIAAARSDGSQMLFLPEGSVEGDDNPPHPEFPLMPDLPILFGSQRGKGPTYQTAFGFDGKWHYADKTRLVIFGEFVPGRSTFPWIAKTFELPTKDLDASPYGVQSLKFGGTHIGPMLCFEGLFPDISYQHALADSQIIAIMCIDDWYMGTPAPEQLRAAATFRAVETGLPVVRSASLGYSVVMDGHGNILGELPLKEAAALKVDVPIAQSSPIFRALPFFPIASLLAVLILPLLPWKKRS